MAAADAFPRHARSWHKDVGSLVPTHRADVTWRTSARNVAGMMRGRRGAHDGDRLWTPASWRVIALLAVLAASVVLIIISTAGAHASVQARSVSALQWAESRAGAPYVYGGTGPGYDCSGLVETAYRHAGVALPRTTYAMLSSSHLVRIAASQRRRGDLAFYGSGHVELVTNRGTYGALEPGTRVGWHRPSGSWRPTMYFRVR